VSYITNEVETFVLDDVVQCSIVWHWVTVVKMGWCCSTVADVV